MPATDSSFGDREALLRELRREDAGRWDLVIVGGGITGAGVLREASRRGYRALLVEQRDFAWGTSSRSSKMVHGGLRYLAAGDVRLTRDSLTERERILREAPGLVERMGYYFTLRRKTFPNRLAMSLVLTVYDWIAGIRDHRYCDNRELRSVFPGLADDDLKGACYYTDAVTDDARLVLRVLQESVQAGGCALNYVPARRLLEEDGEVRGVVLEDPEGGGPLPVRARVVINATGAWADRLRGQVNPERRIRPLRGSHLILPADTLPVTRALALLHPEDRRAVFIFPWEGVTVVGTTDLDHPRDLDVEASITGEEVAYLLTAVRHQFPRVELGPGDIISTYAGIRPVIAAEKARDPSSERRDHAVWSDRGLVTVSGGKLTTFRLIALDALKAASPRLPPPLATVSDAIFSRPTLAPETLVAEDPPWGQRLLGRYGESAEALLAAAPPSERARIPGTGFCLAECRWAIRREAVQHLDDLLLRRTRLGQLLPAGGAALLPTLERMFSEERGWQEDRWQAELGRYRDIWQRYYSLPGADDSEDAGVG